MKRRSGETSGDTLNFDIHTPYRMPIFWGMPFYLTYFFSTFQPCTPLATLSNPVYATIRFRLLATLASNRELRKARHLDSLSFVGWLG